MHVRNEISTLFPERVTHNLKKIVMLTYYGHQRTKIKKNDFGLIV